MHQSKKVDSPWAKKHILAGNGQEKKLPAGKKAAGVLAFKVLNPAPLPTFSQTTSTDGR